MPEKLPPAAAAFANSAAAHALDFDDTHDLARLHTTTVVFPAALAMAELCDRTGAELIDAFVVASELSCRIGLAAKPQGTGPTSHWFMTQLVGYFGAALAAGLVGGLDDDQLVSALGIALSQAAGAKQAAVGTGSNLRAIYPAFAASGGVTAVQLAQSGLVGPPASLEGVAGLWPAFMGAELSAEVLAELTQLDGWEFDSIAIKPWPSCRMAHPYIDAVLSLPVVDTLPDDVVIGVNASAHRLCVPEGDRRRPMTLPDACFSVPFMTAVAIVHRHVDLALLGPEILEDGRVLEVAARVRAEITIEDGPGNPAGTVAIATGGRRLEATGSPAPSASPEAIRAKFDDCLSRAGSADASGSVWRAVGHLASSSVRQFVQDIIAATSTGAAAHSEQ